MRTLDLAPAMNAMQNRPGDFVFQAPWLRHRPSGHSFLMLSGALTRIEARCSCAELRPNRAQLDEFAATYKVWMSTYWQPLQAEAAAERRAAEINRQFAAHFRPPSAVGRISLRLADAWRAAWRELMRPGPPPLHIELDQQPAHAVIEGGATAPTRQGEPVDAA
jgi:hypothetical protein